MDFKELSNTIRTQRKLPIVGDTDVLLAFDPGHTTGWAYFKGTQLILCGEIDTREIDQSVGSITMLMEQFNPSTVVIEDYRVYKWRAKHHAGSNLLTARVIGRIEALCIMNLVLDIFKQPANIAKGFCTDSKLKEWGFFQKGSKHVNDAIRHCCYFLLFGPIKQSDRIQVGPTVG